ncbi:TetR/AcrR family transcriptional regulator [Salinicoccus halodurans]|uniref:Transcriptional regulator, TetR family n=1 Tax=Salinicoccus halodurans TaxID=407035 RepID=A0A0F7HJR2_9STAP|nr:TetR/AcrR family transcriptional regulator [Salinicoccus halodurans]AKG73659.1 hypothetical protein AAT16_05175 [Salinicoccus halodurans]SFK53933.1 transcriptional regulator, TetR family [Salinicoccus halodurans]
MGLRETNKERRRSSIIKTAKAFFVEKGFNAVHMQEIADAEGIGIATLFRYFPKKEQLILAAAISIMESEADAFKNILNHPDKTAYEKIEDCFDYMKGIHISPSANTAKFNDAFQVYIDNTTEPVENLLPYFEARRKIVDHFLQIIEQGKLDGTLHPERCTREKILPILNNFGIYTQKLTMSHSVLNISGDITPSCQLETVSEIYLDYLKPQ